MSKTNHKIKRPNKSNSKEHSVISSMIKGLIYGYIITALCFIVLALLLTYTNLLNSPSLQNVLIILVTVLAVITAGIKTSKSYKDMGWLWGGVTGLVYYIIFFIIAYFVNKEFDFSSSTLSMLLLCIGSGALGGVLGSNKNEA